MTLDDAYKILGVDRTANEAERHNAFATKQQVLEAKIAKAPTPGLKEKYRKGLEQLEEAIEVVELSADGALLPVLEPKSEEGQPNPLQGDPPSTIQRATVSGAPKTKASHGKEIGVMVVLVLLMAAGVGWWFGIVQPKQALALYNVMVAQIESLAKTSSDDQLRDMERLVADYGRNAGSTYSTQAVGVLSARKQAIREYRQEEANRIAEEGRIAEVKAEAEAKAAASAKAKAEAERQSLALSVTAGLNSLRMKAEELSSLQEHAEEKLGELKILERESARGDDALRKSYDATRSKAQKNYVQWLDAFERKHPVKLSINNAEDFARSGNLKAASNEISKGLKSLVGIDDRTAIERSSKYDPLLSQWLLAQTDGKAVRWFKRDEPRILDATVDALRNELSYLDGGASKANVLERLNALDVLVDKDDSDIVRWRNKVLPDLRIESVPSGATVSNSKGSKIGTTPLDLRNLTPGRYAFSVEKNKYLPINLQYISTIDGGNSSKHLDLKRILEPVFGKSWKSDLGEGVLLELLYVAPGSFIMGDPKKRRGGTVWDYYCARSVTIGSGYWLGKFELTQAQWAAIMPKNTSAHPGSDHPANGMTWHNAVLFCERLTEKQHNTGQLARNYKYVLPSEEQWEFACRAGTRSSCYGDIDDIAWYDKNSQDKAHPVGRLQPNAWGFYDMLGNVAELCMSWEADYRPLEKSARCYRGESFASEKESLNAFDHGWGMDFHTKFSNVGFRVALVKIK